MRSRAKVCRNTPNAAGHLRTPRGFPAPVTFLDKDTGVQRRFPNSKYSEPIAKKICEGLMDKRSLTSICSDPGMPSLRTVTRWLADPNMATFRERYRNARQVQAELLVDEIFDIANDTTNDWKPTYNKKGQINGYKPDNEAIQRSRLKVDTIKWYAAKMVPRIYGEHVDVSHDVTGDLAELLKAASNKDTGLPAKQKTKLVNE